MKMLAEMYLMLVVISCLSMTITTVAALKAGRMAEDE